MKHSLAVTLLIYLGSLSTAVAQPPAKPTTWTPELTLQVKRVGSVQVSPDGKRVAYTVREAVMAAKRSEYVTHIHLALADGSESWQLTRGDRSCDDPQWSPDGHWLAFVSSRSGKPNLWLIRPHGGEAQQLTDVKSSVSSFKWAPDGKWIAFAALDAPTAAEEKAKQDKSDVLVVDEDIKLSRLYVVAVAAEPMLHKQARRLTSGKYSIANELGRAGRAPFDWSPDGKTILFTHTRTPSPDAWPSADISEVDVASGKVKAFAKSAAAEYAPLYSPDGQAVAYVCSNNPPTWGGAGRIHVSVKGGTTRALAETKDGWGRYSELLGWSADGRQVYYTEVQGTSLKVLALPLAMIPAPQMPQQVLPSGPMELSKADGMGQSHVTLNATRTMFGYAWETMQQAPEAFVSGVESFKPVQVSKVHRDLPALPLGHTDVIRWKNGDQEVEGLLTYPVGYEKGKRYPLLLVVHGGPMGVFTQTHLAAANPYPIAVFAAQGYAVLRPNPRGSSGYGHKFRHANYGEWGVGDYQDIMSGVEHVIKLGVADENKMGVMGWSYGGYMTSWTITQTKRFKAASVGAGVTNLMSFTGTADIPGFLPDYFGGEFWDKPEAYQTHSAMFRVKGVTTPTLIQHGERDERVPLPQGQELYNALKRQGCTTQMVIYPRTPHGIQEPRLLLDAMQRNVAWFDKYVRGVEPAKPTPTPPTNTSATAAPTPPIQPAAGPVGTKVATLNMVAILKGYKKFDFYRDCIQQIAKPYEEEDTKLKAELKRHAALADDKENSKATREQAEDRVKELKRQIEDNAARGNKAISAKNDEQLVQMFREIEEATKACARQHGIQLVLHYQEPLEKAEIYSAFNVQRKMAGAGKAAASNPIYIADGLDISRTVLEILNKNYPIPKTAAAPSDTHRVDGTSDIKIQALKSSAQPSPAAAQ